MLEEYFPTITYIKGPGNKAEKNLIRIVLINYYVTQRKITRGTSSENYCVDKLDIYTFPLTYQIIDKYE